MYQWKCFYIFLYVPKPKSITVNVVPAVKIKYKAVCWTNWYNLFHQHVKFEWKLYNYNCICNYCVIYWIYFPWHSHFVIGTFTTGVKYMIIIWCIKMMYTTYSLLSHEYVTVISLVHYWREAFKFSQGKKQLNCILQYEVDSVTAAVIWESCLLLWAPKL